jgi:tetratricopeptide (TPR) repeat protein
MVRIKKMVDFLAFWGQFYRDMKSRFEGRFGCILLLALLLSGVGPLPLAHAWRWDEEEIDQDETEVQLQSYRKRVESGMPLQERIVALDRLIKLYQVHHRDTKALEDERAQLVSDENAIQTVSELSRQKAQALFQQAFDLVKLGKYRDAQSKLLEAEHLNPNDKIVIDLRQKMDAVVRVMPEAPESANTGDLVRRGVVQYLQNEPSKSLNFLLYAQQKDPTDKRLPALVDLVKQSYPNETSDILDARLNLIDQKLQRALEKIYSGEYLVAAKECQEVLDLEPENALALTRLGSVYYAMGQVKQARVYWQQALALDSKNDVLRSFLSQSESESDRAPSQALTYKVVKGDTLQKISDKIYKTPSAWRKLYNANRQYLKNAYTLTEGQVLVIPPGQ